MQEMHPRPMLRRERWTSLDGEWHFAIDVDGDWLTPDQVRWETSIEVPFAPETTASGVGETGFFKAVWYRRDFTPPELGPGERLMLHFGAVDYTATVWVNGRRVAHHQGGYTPFSADITEHLHGGASQSIVVRAEDDPHDLAKPRGKQDWQLEPHGIWYPRTTGIWQTVWLEPTPRTFIERLRWTPNVERWELALLAHIQGGNHGDLAMRVRLTCGDSTLADDTYSVANGEVHRRIGLADPGIEDYRNELLWRPAFPTLIDAEVHLLQGGRVMDRLHSYTALRSIDIQGDRFILNGSPYYLRMVLDQGYWPESGQTPPDDDALRRDVELTRTMGFNGARKHQKIEDPRYLYWADHLGLLVWEEMPSAYRFTADSVERLTREWIDVIERDASHPCIVAWVPFNESWGVPNLPDSAPQRHYIQGLYHLTRTLDPTRPVIGNDGWEAVATDIIGIHDYDGQPARIRRRYTAEEMQHRLRRERPGGRMLVLDDDLDYPLPLMLSEFGGIAYAPDRQEGDWGYSVSESAEKFAERYTALLEVVRSQEVFCGFCYTQFADTYQEINGLLYADRTPKFPLEQIHTATRGPRAPREREVEAEWRERLMGQQRRHYQIPAEDHRVQQG